MACISRISLQVGLRDFRAILSDYFVKNIRYHNLE